MRDIFCIKQRKTLFRENYPFTFREIYAKVYIHQVEVGVSNWFVSYLNFNFKGVFYYEEKLYRN